MLSLSVRVVSLVSLFIARSVTAPRGKPNYTPNHLAGTGRAVL